ncbi:MAG: type II secretion system F family protein [Kiritimatiellaeota bacterium]|nr:type II secretion system F family protein [Kiritimatiellota bacterium]
MQDLHIALAMLFAALSAAAAAWHVLSLTSQMTYVTLADGRRQERKLPFLFRMLLPLAHNLDPMTRSKALEKTVEKFNRDLVSAGFDGLLSGREFAALKVLVPLTLAPLWWLLLTFLGSIMPDPFAENQLLLVLLGAMFFYARPMMWLRGALKARHRSIQRALPFVLDLLTLAVEAGLDFMSAMQRNCERRRPDPLNEELIRMIREIQLGAQRRAALRNMAVRVNLADLRAVCNALIQADELGVSIGAMLRIQADQLRQRRFDRAEKLANEAPVKMLAPLLLCIFPAVFIIILAPMLPQVKGLF